jgi:hypothetical protein
MTTKTLGTTKVFYPTLNGGKYHQQVWLAPIAKCQPTTILDLTAMPIQYQADMSPADAHPIVCKKCLNN